VVRFSLPSDADGMLICGEVLVEWMYDADRDSQQHLSRIVNDCGRMEMSRFSTRRMRGMPEIV
jgi:hypothetical protein